MGKIFIINPAGEIHQLNNTYIKSYPKLDDMVDLIFPHLNHFSNNALEEFNEVNYWKIKIDPNIDISKLI